MPLFFANIDRFFTGTAIAARLFGGRRADRCLGLGDVSLIGGAFPYSVSRSGRLLGGLVFMLAISSWVLACKYSVRDVGFVDLQSSDYQLWLISEDIEGATSGALSSEAAAWLAVARTVLVDTNVEPAVVARSELAERWPAQASLPAEVLQWLDADSRQGRLRSLLVLPDGQAWYPVEWSAAPTSAAAVADSVGPSPQYTDQRRPDSPLSGELVTDLWWDDLERLVDSPLRQQLLDQMLSSHCLVLVFEGSEADGNQRAREVAQRAIDRSDRWLADLPKATAGPPRMHVVTADQRRQEGLLMWSLGIDASPLAEQSIPIGDWAGAVLSPDEMLAGVVVLFGRLRPMGPPIFEPLLTAVELGERMQLVGADCECGLDRSWMQGRMAVHRWDDDRRQVAAESLGFDAENTMVKVEISRILARGGSAVGVAGEVAGRLGQTPNESYTLPELGYSERVILGHAPAAAETAAPIQSPAVAQESSPAVVERDDTLRWFWWMAGGLVLASLLGGGLLWWLRPGG